MPEFEITTHELRDVHCRYQVYAETFENAMNEIRSFRINMINTDYDGEDVVMLASEVDGQYIPYRSEERSFNNIYDASVYLAAACLDEDIQNAKDFTSLITKKDDVFVVRMYWRHNEH